MNGRRSAAIAIVVGFLALLGLLLYGVRQSDRADRESLPSPLIGRAAIDWGIYGAPETFLVDAAGIVRWKHVGPLTDDIIERELSPLVASLGGAK